MLSIIRFVDPDGSAPEDPTDYYNISGFKVFHVNDGKKEKGMALVYGGEKAIRREIDKGATLDVETNDSVDKMSDAFDLSEANSGNEVLYVIGESGTNSELKLSPNGK